MSTISGIRIENSSPTGFQVSDGAETYTLPAAIPGQQGTLDLQIQISTYTISNGSLTVARVEINPDATVTVSGGNGGLNSPISITTTISPA